MRIFGALIFFIVIGPLLAASAVDPADEALSATIHTFVVKEVTLPAAVSELSGDQVGNEIHLGVEEILSDVRPTAIKALDLREQSLRQILNVLCEADARYTWAVEGATINIFPKAMLHDSTYFMNFKLSSITLTGILAPPQVLRPISLAFPSEQVGYRQVGGDYDYASPWTTTLTNVTVRQVINRAAEHMGLRSFWTLSGDRDERFFAFFRRQYFVSPASSSGKGATDYHVPNRTREAVESGWGDKDR